MQEPGVVPGSLSLEVTVSFLRFLLGTDSSISEDMWQKAKMSLYGELNRLESSRSLLSHSRLYYAYLKGIERRFLKGDRSRGLYDRMRVLRK